MTDNYYSSVALSKELLSRGIYHLGTARVNRLGWPKDLSYKNKSRPAGMQRGAYKIATCREIPELLAVSWMDSRPVNFLATGCGTRRKFLQRKEKDGSWTTVPCPELIELYNHAMGGVDQHDQLRLHRYSIQTRTRFRKYYKAIFLAVVDMAMVNGYIIHRHSCRSKGTRAPTHAEYLEQLHEQLLALNHSDFEHHPLAENLATEPLPELEHKMVQTDEMYRGKHRPFLCKVCSALSTVPKKDRRSFESSYVCKACESEFGGRVALCICARRGQTLTCAQIWHDAWNNGHAIPPEQRRKIRFRKRKREDK